MDAHGVRVLVERIHQLEERINLLKDLKNGQAVEIVSLKEDAFKMKKEMEDRESKMNGQLTTMKKEVADYKSGTHKEMQNAKRFKDQLDTAMLQVEKSGKTVKEKEREIEALKKKLAACEKEIEELQGVNQFLADTVEATLDRGNGGLSSFVF